MVGTASKRDNIKAKAKLEQKIANLTQSGIKLVRAANYNQGDLEVLFAKASSLKTIETALNIAGGAIVVAAFTLGGQIQDKEAQLLPVIPAVAAVFAASRVRNCRYGMTIEIGRKALKEFYPSSDEVVIPKDELLQEHFKKYGIQQGNEKHNRNHDRLEP